MIIPAREEADSVFNPSCSQCDEPIGNFGIFEWDVVRKINLTFCSDDCYRAHKAKRVH